MALEYAMYQLHQQIETANHAARASICQQQREILENVPVQMQPGRLTSPWRPVLTASPVLLRFWNCQTTGMIFPSKEEDSCSSRGIEDQDWFWWPSHQNLILRALAYGDCVGAGECKGAEVKGLPLYVLANLRTEMKGSVDNDARGLLREWGDILALVCIILCMMDMATRMIVALKIGLRTARN